MASKELIPTAAEQLLVWRRRKGHSQVAAAELTGVTVDTYRDWECGVRETGIPRHAITNLSTNEVCFLLRRRKGWTQIAVGKLLGVSRLWIHRMEHAQVAYDRLANFWGV